jgi:orotate phosphoribosyltransferase
MSALEELITKAKALQAEGHTPGQISDELGLSMETVTWLLTQPKGMEAPKDVHIDWTAVGSHGTLLDDMAMMMLKRFLIAMSSTSTGRRLGATERCWTTWR